MIDDLLEMCNIRYKKLKMSKFFYRAPETFNDVNIESDEVKAVVKVFESLVNEKIKENLDLKNQIENLRSELKSFKDYVKDTYEKK